jgi:hypothetical protein
VRQRYIDVLEWERKWALGFPLTDEETAETFFVAPARARSVYLAVAGVSVADRLRTRGDLHPGHVLLEGVMVGTLTADDVALLRAGGDPWGER